MLVLESTRLFCDSGQRMCRVASHSIVQCGPVVRHKGCDTIVRVGPIYSALLIERRAV